MEEARAQYDAALTIYKNRQEGMHPRTGYAMVGLAYILMRDPKKDMLSRRLLEEALHVFRSVYLDGHPTVSTIFGALKTMETNQIR